MTKQNTVRVVFASMARARRPPTPNVVYYDPTTFTLWSTTLPPASRPKINLILAILLARYPGWVSYGELIHACWGDDKSGGPDNAANVLRQLIYYARNPADALGFDIISGYGRGYRVEQKEGRRLRQPSTTLLRRAGQKSAVHCM